MPSTVTSATAPTLTDGTCALVSVAVASNDFVPMMTMASVLESALTVSPTLMPTETIVPLIGLVSCPSARRLLGADDIGLGGVDRRLVRGDLCRAVRGRTTRRGTALHSLPVSRVPRVADVAVACRVGGASEPERGLLLGDGLSQRRLVRSHRPLICGHCLLIGRDLLERSGARSCPPRAWSVVDGGRRRGRSGSSVVVGVARVRGRRDAACRLRLRQVRRFLLLVRRRRGLIGDQCGLILADRALRGPTAPAPVDVAEALGVVVVVVAVALDVSLSSSSVNLASSDCSESSAEETRFAQ